MSFGVRVGKVILGVLILRLAWLIVAFVHCNCVYLHPNIRFEDPTGYSDPADCLVHGSQVE